MINAFNFPGIPKKTFENFWEGLKHIFLTNIISTELVFVIYFLQILTENASNQKSMNCKG